MGDQFFFKQTSSDVFHADSKPLINPRAMPSDVKIIALQKHFEPHQGRESILMRVENLYQKSDNIVAPVELQLGKNSRDFDSRVTWS